MFLTQPVCIRWLRHRKAALSLIAATNACPLLTLRRSSGRRAPTHAGFRENTPWRARKGGIRVPRRAKRVEVDGHFAPSWKRAAKTCLRPGVRAISKASPRSVTPAVRVSAMRADPIISAVTVTRGAFRRSRDRTSGNNFRQTPSTVASVSTAAGGDRNSGRAASGHTVNVDRYGESGVGDHRRRQAFAKLRQIGAQGDV